MIELRHAGFHLEILSRGGKSGVKGARAKVVIKQHGNMHVTSQVPSENLMDLPATSMCTEHEVYYTYKYTVGKILCDLSVEQGVGAGGGRAPSHAECEAKGKN